MVINKKDLKILAGNAIRKNECEKLNTHLAYLIHFLNSWNLSKANLRDMFSDEDAILEHTASDLALIKENCAFC
jgi:hypothetical protein